MDFGAAISKPFSNIKNLIIGIVLLIIPILNILTIPGYILRVANRTMNNDNSLPGFDNFGELIINSLKVIVVGIVYGLILFIVALILALIPYVGVVLALIWNIIFVFIAISAIMNMAKTGNIGDAFHFGEILHNTKNGGFIASVIIATILVGIILVLVLAVLVFAFAASMIPIFMSIFAGGTVDPNAIMALLAGLAGAFFIGSIILIIVEYILIVFFYSLVASAYPK